MVPARQAEQKQMAVQRYTAVQVSAGYAQGTVDLLTPGMVCSVAQRDLAWESTFCGDSLLHRVRDFKQ